MKIVIAPDSFKECLSAVHVAQVMAQVVQELYPEAEVVLCPLADGGEGTLEALARSVPMRMETVSVHDPLGRLIPAHWGQWGKEAVIESAQACGLMLLSPLERNPCTASSQGVGELLMDAYRQGFRHFIIGLGGSATCDGGAGMLAVPGIREALRDSTIELLCDVEAPFVGPLGAARVFAPQKGATPEQVEELELKMLQQAAALKAETGVDVSRLSGAGAAGGLGGAFMAYGARMQKGIERMLDMVGFKDQVRGADLIITGEGKSDAQTLMGKVPFGVLQLAGTTPVALVSGQVQDRYALEQAGFSVIEEVSPRSQPLEEAMRPEIAVKNLSKAVAKTLINFFKS